MRLCIVLLYFAASALSATIDFHHIPSSISLDSTKSGDFKTSSLPDLVSQLLGFNAHKVLPGLKTNLWSKPEAVAIIQLESDEVLPISPFKKVSIEQDVSPDYATNFFEVADEYSDGGFSTVDVADTIDGTFTGTLEPASLSADGVASDSLLMKELRNAMGLQSWLKANKASVVNGIPDIFVIRINGLVPVDGATEVTTKQTEAVVQVVNQLLAEFERTYEGNVATLIVQLKPAVHSRPPRLAAQQAPGAAGLLAISAFTRARWYDANYAAAFNMCLWTCIFLAITVFGVGVWMWFMDPGRDSIIYRVTSRAKRD